MTCNFLLSVVSFSQQMTPEFIKVALAAKCKLGTCYDKAKVCLVLECPAEEEHLRVEAKQEAK